MYLSRPRLFLELQIDIDFSKHCACTPHLKPITKVPAPYKLHYHNQRPAVYLCNSVGRCMLLIHGTTQIKPFG